MTTSRFGTQRADQPSPEEGDVDDGGERVDELENEGLEDESFLKTLVCFGNL